MRLATAQVNRGTANWLRRSVIVFPLSWEPGTGPAATKESSMGTKLDSQISRRTLLGAAGGASALALAGALPRLALGQSPVASPAAITPYNGEEVTISYG